MDTLRKVHEVEKSVKNTTTEITDKLYELTDSFARTMKAMQETVTGSSKRSNR